MAQASARGRRLADRLAREGGPRVELSTEPVELTAEQAQAVQRGETVAYFTGHRGEAHAKYEGFEASASDEEILRVQRGQRARVERIKRGEERPDFEAGHDPSDPEWMRYIAEKKARRERAIRGER